MKNVLVTGATGDIGFAIAEAFAEKGYNVALHTFSKTGQAEKKAEELCRMYNVNTTFVTADVSDENAVKTMFDY